MKLLIVNDLHGNGPALKAVLSSPQAQGYDRFVSMGDHTGFGPDPAGVTRMLKEHDAVILRGNHEARLANYQQYQGYNWALLHWIAGQVSPQEAAELPIDFRCGPVLMTHIRPGNLEQVIHEPDLPAVLAELPQEISLLVTGHIHAPWRVDLNGKTALNAGATGMLEDGLGGGRAPFIVLDVNGTQVEWQVYHAHYDPRETLRDYLRTGAYHAAPELCRCAWTIMNTGNAHMLIDFLRFAHHYGEAHRLPANTKETFAAADAEWQWPNGETCAEFWKRVKKEG